MLPVIIKPIWFWVMSIAEGIMLQGGLHQCRFCVITYLTDWLGHHLTDATVRMSSVNTLDSIYLDINCSNNSISPRMSEYNTDQHHLTMKDLVFIHKLNCGGGVVDWWSIEKINTFLKWWYICDASFPFKGSHDYYSFTRDPQNSFVMWRVYRPSGLSAC